MNYQVFYQEVAKWILEVNSKAGQFGMNSQEFWDWTTSSSNEFNIKYNGNKLVYKQMMMLMDWLHETHESMQK
ncbi:hypothetical protein ACTHQ4_02270 [Alkalicoccobacillus gibsonii]|uniref:hypothetical protein n=1 Tax=Alkalicoccobacillus gibsonii TaxID=79881 RepID=UPI003F7C8DC5